MHFHARDALAKRGGLEIEQPQSRYADEDEFVAKKLGRGLSGKHILGRDEALRIVTPEIHVQRAVGLDRNRRRTDVEVHVLAALVVDAQLLRAGGDANHLHRKRRHDDFSDPRNQGDSPQDAIR